MPFVGLLGNPAALGEAFHITRHMEAYAWNDIFAEMAHALQVEPDFVHVPTETLIRYEPEWIGPLWGDKAYSVLFDNTKTMQVAGPFQCQVSLRDIMQQAAEHYARRPQAISRTRNCMPGWTASQRRSAPWDETEAAVEQLDPRHPSVVPHRQFPYNPGPSGEVVK